MALHYSGRRTEKGTIGHIASDGGSITHTARRLPRGFSYRAGDRQLPVVWNRFSRGATTRDCLGGLSLPCLNCGISTAGSDRRRAETGLAANVGDDAPQPPHLDGKRKWRHGQLAA